VLRFSLSRVVEAYVGEYASGKSEMAINRALELKSQGRQVTLVDLDTVEPFYTLRPLKELLEQKGLTVIGLTPANSFGLGETGAMLVPAARWALRREGDIILDVGYGVYGAQTLNLVEGADTSTELRVIAVINYSRPMTSTKGRIIEYVKELGRVDALVANTHLGDETTSEVIEKGTQVILECAEELGIPVDYIAVDRKLADKWSPDFGVPVKWITRYMPAAVW
jgi:hypothetical protein